MRKFYFLLLGLLIFSGVQAQIVNIPDANFKSKLLAASTNNVTAYYIKIDTNNNGEIEVSEALKVTAVSYTHLDVYKRQIKICMC